MLQSWPSINKMLTDFLRFVHTKQLHDMSAVSFQLANFTQLLRVRLQRSLLVPQEKASWNNARNTSLEGLISGLAKM